jgi:hypothetical protein
VKAVQELLPVWGHRFVRQFLEFCLPTLLAPGNVPALANAPAPVRHHDERRRRGAIQMHPAWVHLPGFAKEYLIDELVTDGNHSATITLAYARRSRDRRRHARTCFIFLVSDYTLQRRAQGVLLAGRTAQGGACRQLPDRRRGGVRRVTARSGGPYISLGLAS